MGATPHVDHPNSVVTLRDTAENLRVGLTALTEGQIASFNQIKISDSGLWFLIPRNLRL